MPRKQKVRPTTRHVALCYIRQSFTRDASDTNSPERQRANIQTVCDREGWTPEWYMDAEGHKSGRDEQNRPEWLRLKERLSDPDVVALVANDMSRTHRKAWRVGRMVDELLEPQEIRLVLAAPGREIDTSTPMGRMLLMMIAMQDEGYANDISQRTKDAIKHRKRQGKTVGLPPFGTTRNKDGYLIPSTNGAWLLPSGQFMVGTTAETMPPVEGAVWRGYYDCARRMLELYAENRMGRERIAYEMNDEGWAFRDRKRRPRPIRRADVRRVTSNWREYAGIVTQGRAKDQVASQIGDPSEILHDTGRAVFPLELLQRVATVQEKRSQVKRPRGSVKVAYPYVLGRLIFCAYCEQMARKHDNPDLRTRLSGVDQYGKLRYRHVTGVKCGCNRRSVFTHIIEDEFRLLIDQLTLDPKALDLMVELAVQSEHGMAMADTKEDLEKQKQEAIAKCQRRIEAAKMVYLDGDMSRAEYISVKEQNEREIAHWQTRTAETEKAAVELQMCLNAINQMVKLWDQSTEEDRQNMAHMLFEYITYDLDKQQIVDFRLKAWADRYLVLRSDLYGDGSEGTENENRSSLNETSDLCPIGDSNSCFCLERAAS